MLKNKSGGSKLQFDGVFTTDSGYGRTDGAGFGPMRGISLSLDFTLILSCKI